MKRAFFGPPSGYVELSTLAGVKIDLKYATADNFTGEVLYQGLTRCFLHPLAVRKFKKAIAFLREKKPGYAFLVFDGLRPRSVQRRMWARVKNTLRRQYVADPAKGSMHNFGMALDLTLLDKQGRELDMGTAYDTFSSLSQPRLEQKFLKSGRLSRAQVKNRLLLRQAMQSAGFFPLPNEWWHFDALPEAETRKKYKIIE